MDASKPLRTPDVETRLSPEVFDSKSAYYNPAASFTNEVSLLALETEKFIIVSGNANLIRPIRSRNVCNVSMASELNS